MNKDQERFFEWIAKVCELSGKSIEDGAELIKDPNWFYCYEDGLSPENAIAEALDHNVL